MNFVKNKQCNFHTLYYASRTIGSDFFMNSHYHPRVEIMYCESGEFEVEFFKYIDGKLTCYKTEALSVKQFIVIDYNVIHRVKTPASDVILLNIEFMQSRTDKSANPTDDRIFNFNFERFLESSPAFFNTFSEADDYAIIKDTAMVKNSLLQYINKLSSRKTLDDRLEAKLYLYTVFIEISKCCANQVNKLGSRCYNCAYDYISNNYFLNITIDDVARHCGVSKYHLQRIFKKQAGVSIHEKLTQLRIERCKQFLQHSSYNIDVICQECGFNNRQTMLYEFNKSVGMSPSKYRENHNLSTVEIMPVQEEIKNIDTVELKMKE